MFMTPSLCSHKLAVADHQKVLPELLSWYTTKKHRPNLIQVVRASVSQKTGKKPSARQRKTGGGNKPRNVLPEPPGNIQKPSFRLKWLDTTRAYLCYGCNRALRPDKDIPPAPFNVVVCSNEYRTYLKKAIGRLDMTLKKTDCHFHLRCDCIERKQLKFDASYLEITEIDNAKFTQAHKRQILHEFGLTQYL